MNGGGNLGINGSGLDQRIYYQQDREYNVVAITDQSGSVVERYAYDPYGSQSALDQNWNLLADGSVYGNQIGFTGRWLDSTGMWYFRARYLEPVLGRFVSRDPAAGVDGEDRYCAYFVPQGIDPTGERQVKIFADMFIPDNRVRDPLSPPGSTYYFLGDGRSFGQTEPPDAASRISNWIIVDLDATGTDAKVSSHSQQNPSHEVLPDGPGWLGPVGIPLINPYQPTVLTKTGVLKSHAETATHVSDCHTRVHLSNYGSDPFSALAPSFGYDYTIDIFKNGTGANPQFSMTGKHQTWPAFEIFIANKQFFTDSPPAGSSWYSVFSVNVQKRAFLGSRP